jgi:hypothetical protein
MQFVPSPRSAVVALALMVAVIVAPSGGSGS